MYRYEEKESRITKNQINMIPPKETNEVLITDLQEMEICQTKKQRSE